MNYAMLQKVTGIRSGRFRNPEERESGIEYEDGQSIGDSPTDEADAMEMRVREAGDIGRFCGRKLRERERESERERCQFVGFVIW